MSKPDFVWPALDQAASDAQDIESRRENAVKEGYAAGHAKGLSAAQAELAGHYQRLADALQTLERQCSWLQRANAESLHSVVSEVLTRVLDVELSGNSDVYRHFLERGVQALAGEPPKLQLNEATLERLRALEVNSEQYVVDVEASLGDGAIRLVTADAIIDFDPKNELQRLLALAEPDDRAAAAGPLEEGSPAEASRAEVPDVD